MSGIGDQGAGSHGAAADQNGQRPGKQREADAVFTAHSGVLRCHWQADSSVVLPPYHSKYNPIERCWGILELHWNGTKLVDVETMVEWAKSMTWKGIHPIVTLSRKVYQKGGTLSKRAMRAVEDRLERHPELPYWDILIQPVSAS